MRFAPSLCLFPSSPLDATVGESCLAVTGQPDDVVSPWGRWADVGRDRAWGEGGGEVACHGESSQRARGEQGCLQDDCLLFLVVQTLFINLQPLGSPAQKQGMEMGTGGAAGCKAIAPVTTRDPLPSWLPVCLNADLCHPLPTRDCFLTKQKQERMHRDTDNTHTHTHEHTCRNTYTSQPAHGKRGVTKDRHCPLVFSSKRNQTKISSPTHHPLQTNKHIRRKAKGRWGGWGGGMKSWIHRSNGITCRRLGVGWVRWGKTLGKGGI